MIAIPVLERGQELKSINLFTRAKQFLLLDTAGNRQLYSHQHTSGKTLALDLIERGVTTLITNHMGRTPYNLLSAAGVKLLYLDGSHKVDDLLQLLQAGKLESFTAEMVHASHHQHQHHNHGAEHSCNCGA